MAENIVHSTWAARPREKPCVQAVARQPCRCQSSPICIPWQSGDTCDSNRALVVAALCWLLLGWPGVDACRHVSWRLRQVHEWNHMGLQTATGFKWGSSGAGPRPPASPHSGAVPRVTPPGWDARSFRPVAHIGSGAFVGYPRIRGNRESVGPHRAL